MPTTGEAAGRALVVCHGFKGFKDWGFFPYAARHLSESLAVPVVTFNFAGSGIGPDLRNFTDPEAFGRNTFGKEADDLEAVLEGLVSGRLGDVACEPAARVGVVGHSRGGVAAILAGEHSAVEAVATWAAIASVERYARLFDGLPPGESVMVTNARTGDRIPLYPDVAVEARAMSERFDLARSLQRSRVPLLVVHGTDDATVAPDDALTLATARDDVRLELIEGAGHTFEAGHPFEGPSPAFGRVLELTVGHFDRFL